MVGWSEPIAVDGGDPGERRDRIDGVRPGRAARRRPAPSGSGAAPSPGAPPPGRRNECVLPARPDGRGRRRTARERPSRRFARYLDARRREARDPARVAGDRRVGEPDDDADAATGGAPVATVAARRNGPRGARATNVSAARKSALFISSRFDCHRVRHRSSGLAGAPEAEAGSLGGWTARRC